MREDVRRVLRALGRSPFVFEDMDELKSIGERIKHIEMLLLVCPDCIALPNQLLIGQARKITSECIPMFVAVGRGRLLITQGQDKEEMAAGPFSFSDLYSLLHDFSNRHGIRIAPSVPRWGRYRFHVQLQMVALGSARVKLAPCDFDLAIELFFGMNRLVPLRRLRSIVTVYGGREAEESLISRIAHLQLTLHLNATHGWRLESVPEMGYRLVNLHHRAPEIPIRPNVADQTHDPSA
jgi:hypothetical protein